MRAVGSALGVPLTHISILPPAPPRPALAGGRLGISAAFVDPVTANMAGIWERRGAELGKARRARRVSCSGD